MNADSRLSVFPPNRSLQTKSEPSELLITELDFLAAPNTLSNYTKGDLKM